MKNENAIILNNHQPIICFADLLVENHTYCGGGEDDFAK